MMRPIITTIILLAAVATASAVEMPLKAGKTNELSHEQSIYAKRIEGTNLFNVTYIRNDGPNGDRRTVTAKRGDVEIYEPNLMIIHLRDLELLDEPRNGRSQRVWAEHLPVEINLQMLKKFQKEYGKYNQ